MADEHEQANEVLRRSAMETLPAGKPLYHMTTHPNKWVRFTGWIASVVVVGFFAFGVYTWIVKVFARTPSDKAKAVMVLRFDVKAFDKELIYAGDHFDPQMDASDLQLKWGPQIDTYAYKLVGNLEAAPSALVLPTFFDAVETTGFTAPAFTTVRESLFKQVLQAGRVIWELLVEVLNRIFLFHAHNYTNIRWTSVVQLQVALNQCFTCISNPKYYVYMS